MGLEPCARLVTAEYAFAVYDTVLVEVWAGKATVDAARALRSFTRRWTDQIETIVVFMEHFGGLPDESTLAEIAAFVRDFRSVSVLTVFEGTDFKAAALRAIVTSVFTLAGQRHQMRVFSSLRDAADWAHEKGRSLPELSSLDAHVASLRAELQSRAPSA